MAWEKLPDFSDKWYVLYRMRQQMVIAHLAPIDHTQNNDYSDLVHGVLDSMRRDYGDERKWGVQ